MYLAVLGRHPNLSLAELVSCYGSGNVQPLNEHIALVQSPTIDLNRLGGTLKLAKVDTTIASSDYRAIEQSVLSQLGAYTKHASGKLNFGISVYGQLSLPKVRQLGLNLKKTLKQAGKSARFIPNKSPALSTAQVLHNHLTSGGLEVLIAIGKQQTAIGHSMAVQDIAAYAERDYARPQRDAKVGMLPPKLAQIMINLAQPPVGGIILDPFCGTGVVLQEAMLMGYAANGSDIEPRMVEYAQKNLDWLTTTHQQPNASYHVQTADAQNASFPTPIDAVVSEVYLGPPLAREPRPEQLEQIRTSVNQLVVRFLGNLSKQIKPGTPLCLALPVWQTGVDSVQLPLIDQLERLGYNYRKFAGIDPSNLIYRRPDQVVGRQLLVITKV